MSSYEAQRVLNLIKDQTPPLSRNRTSASLCEPTPREFRSPVRRHTSATVQPESVSISRTNSEISLHPPMRRRSMIQTPGVATRTRPSPSTARSRRSSLRHSHPPTPSMSRQPSFDEAAENRHLSLPPLPIPTCMNGDTPRVLTPKDSDYTTTGAFKFGTLRITNGSPVLTPRLSASHGDGAEKSKPPATCGPDYFAPNPFREVDESPVAVHGLPQLLTVSETEGQPDPTVKPIKTGRPNCELAGQSSLPQTTVEMHQQPPASPLLQVQSKKAAAEDDLFEDDAQQDVSMVEILDVRLDPNARSLPSQTLSLSQPEGVTRSDSGFVSNPKSESSQSSNSLSKADSGYSSNVSLRSLQNPNTTVTPEKQVQRSSAESDRGSSNPPSRELRRSAGIMLLKSTAAKEGFTVDSLHQDKPPTPPPKDNRRPDPTTPIMSGVIRKKPVQQHSEIIDASKPKEKRDVGSPQLVSDTPAIVVSEESTSSGSIGNNTHKPGRLQRLLSLRNSTKQPLTAYETHTVENDVPLIPGEAEDKLREHTGLYPVTARKLTMKSQMSKETLKTIMSVGSLEWAKDGDLAPTPTTSGDEDDDAETIRDTGNAQEKSSRQTFSSMQSNIRSVAASVMQNRKSITRKPVPAQQNVKDDSMHDVEADLASYVSVNRTLGGNACDVATKAMQPGHRPSRSQSMNTRREHHQRMRTYSLDAAPLGISPDSDGSALNTPKQKAPPAEKRRKSPPVSMLTRKSYRSPPPRSPLRPQGPAVLQSAGQQNVSSPTRSALPPSHARGGQSTAVPNHAAANSSEHSAYRNSPGSLGSSPANIRHSIYSARSDFFREPRASQSYDQNVNGPTLKHQSSLDGFGRNQLRGVYVPSPAAHQGPARSEPSQHWNPQNSSYLGDSGFQPGQLAWVPPYVPRGHHRRNLSAGSRPYYHQAEGSHAPYRILHSYNSPAYRNAPIWG